MITKGFVQNTIITRGLGGVISEILEILISSESFELTDINSIISTIIEIICNTEKFEITDIKSIINSIIKSPLSRTLKVDYINRIVNKIKHKRIVTIREKR